MKLYTKSWNKFKFLITPDEFESIFRDFHHIEYNHRVPKDYIETDPKILFNKYKGFYEKLVSNYKFVWKTDADLFDLHMGFTNDLNKCVYEKEFIDKNDNKFYKTMDWNTEPCVGMSPFILFLDGKNKLLSNIFYAQYPENAMGIQLEFPKEMSCSENSETVNCTEIETYNNVYKKIVEKINKISRNLVFTIGEKEYKPPIKVSKNISEEIKNVYFIKNNNCIIK